MNIWHDINPKRITVDEFVAVVEIPKNSKVKYELNKDTGILEMDRILYTSTHYPANYGFIPRTYADDGDPLDVLVLCSQTLHPMTLVRSYPIGVIHMTRHITAITTSTICPVIFLRRSCTSFRCTKSWNIRRPRWTKWKTFTLQRRSLRQTSTTISTSFVRLDRHGEK